MLIELSIFDFAIIDQVRIDAGPGLTVLTGETGAGKSIIIDALGAVLGARVGSEYIREGASSARVEGVFGVPEPLPPALRERLDDYGIEPEDGAILLGREVGKSRATARANGRAVPASVLQAIGGLMVVLHGQTDHLAILRSSDQLNLLDRFAGLQARRAAMSEAVSRLRRIRAERETLERDEREAARRLEMLRFQIDEIERAALRPDEDRQLEREIQVLASAERLQETAELLLTLLTGDGGDEASAHDLLGRIDQALLELARIDPSAQPMSSTATGLLETAVDLARDLRHFRDQIEHDPERLATAQDRLDLVKQLKRKYGASIDDIIAFGDEARREAGLLSHREERQAELAGEEGALVQEASRLASDLHRARVSAGAELAKRVERELQDLSMPGARFQVALRQTDDPDGLPCVLGDQAETPGPYAFAASGIDQAEFLVAPNVGESLKPAAKIASGGETSRMMLALQSVLSEADDTPTMVFDEVDVGVGGRNGQVLGEKLWSLARHRQVFCITHLPQVAVFGDDHLKITKEVIEGRTRTVVCRLAADTRFEELAQMLGGHGAGDTAAAAARELLDRATAWKRSHGDVDISR